MGMSAVDATSHMAFNWIMFLLSLFSNVLLILLVRKVKVISMGSYTILIYISAVMDVLIALSNAIVVPNIHMGEYSFVVFGVGTAHWPALPGLVSIYVFDLLFYQTFALLCFHFLYRYVVLLGSSSSLSYLSVWHWAAAGVVFEVLFNGVMAYFISHYEPRDDWKADDGLVADMLDFYGINMTQPFGHFHVVYAVNSKEVDGSGSMSWNWTIVIYTLSILGLITMLGVVMILCSMGVLRMMRSLSSDSNIRASTHKQFFRALVIQTVVPLAISFTPVGCLVLLPLTGGKFGALGNYLMSISTLYPAVDPWLLIVCIQSYRRQIRSWCECCLPRKYRTVNRVRSNSQFTPSIVQTSTTRLAIRNSIH